MDIQKKQAIIDKLDYWDTRVLKMECDYFADEVLLEYEDNGGNVAFKFNGCYKTIFEHIVSYEKEVPVKKLSRIQLPYFLQNVEIGSVKSEGVELYTCKISMYPLDLEIWCKDIEIQKYFI